MCKEKRKELIKMTIIQKETISLNPAESNALDLIQKLCASIEEKSNNLELRRLANEIYHKIDDLFEVGEFVE